MNIRILLIIAVLLPAVSQAQMKNLPVKNEAELKHDLFELEDYQYNHAFKTALPGDNFLLIDFHKWSYWPDTSVLQQIFNIAARAANSAKDSLSNPLTSKRIDVHVPVKNQPITMRFAEYDDGSDLVVLNYDQQAPLKLGMDTIRILKTFAVEKSDDEEEIEERHEILYTFILKDFKKMKELADNHAVIADVAATFDTQVKIRRDRWNREDTWYHDIDISYSPMEAEEKNKLVVENHGTILKGIEAKYYIGASLFRNSLVPDVEIGLSYKWPISSIGEYANVRISSNALGHFERINESTYNFYNTTFVNIEFGTLVNKSGTVIPIYETSLGFGYMFTDLPSLKPYKCYKMFWHYSLSPAMRITPEFYLLSRKNQENYIWAGLTIALRIL